MKLNSAGTLQWQKCFGGNANETAYHIQAAQDGGFLVAGTAESGDGDLTCNAGITDGWIIKVSATGTLQWQKQLGGNYYDEPHCIRELSDGSYIMLGQTVRKISPDTTWLPIWDPAEFLAGEIIRADGLSAQSRFENDPRISHDLFRYDRNDCGNHSMGRTESNFSMDEKWRARWR